MKKRIITLVIIGLIVWLFFYFSGIMHMVNRASRIDSIVTVSDIPKDYLKLFKENNKLSFDETVISKTRNPISQFDYDGKFLINIYRIDISNSMPLSEIIEESYKSNQITYNYTYNTLNDFDKSDKYAISYKSGKQDEVQLIYLNLFGEGTFTIKKNDTLAYYYSRAKNFYIKYRKNGMQDFFVGPVYGNEYEQVKIPMEVLLLKRSGKLYFILITADKENIYLEPGTLLTLINN